MHRRFILMEVVYMHFHFPPKWLWQHPVANITAIVTAVPALPVGASPDGLIKSTKKKKSNSTRSIEALHPAATSSSLNLMKIPSMFAHNGGSMSITSPCCLFHDVSSWTNKARGREASPGGPRSRPADKRASPWLTSSVGWKRGGANLHSLLNCLISLWPSEMWGGEERQWWKGQKEKNRTASRQVVHHTPN